MQKSVYSILLFLIFLTDFGQPVNNCPYPVYITSNYTFNFSNWDWTNSDPCNWIAYPAPGPLIYMKPAFDANNTDMNARMLEINQNKDYLNDDPGHLIQEDQGWELFTAMFSTSNPYFILYNKYRSSLRVFVYIDQRIQNNDIDQYLITLGVTDNGIGILSHNSLPVKPLELARNEDYLNYYTYTYSNFSYNSWICAEYNIAFDPLVANSSSDLLLFVKVRGVTTFPNNIIGYSYDNVIAAQFHLPGQTFYNSNLYSCPLGVIGYQDPIEIKNTSDYVYDTPIPDYKILGQTVSPGRLSKTTEGYQGTFCKFRVSNTPHFVFNSASQIDFVNMKAGLIITPTYQDPSSPLYYDITSEYIQTVHVTTSNYPSYHRFNFKNPLYDLIQNGEAEIITLPDGRKACHTHLKAIECLQNYTLELPVHSEIYLSTYTTFNKSTFSTPITLHHIYDVKHTWVNTGSTMTIQSGEEYPHFPKSDYSLTNCTGTIRPITDYYYPLTCDHSLVTNITNHQYKEEEKFIVISPNPNNGSFQYTLRITPNSSYELYLLNSSGEQVYYNIVEDVETTNEINVSLPPGIYLLKIISEGKSYHSKVVIQ